VSQRSEAISENVEQMSLGTGEVAQSANSASEVARRAELSAKNANSAVAQLGTSSEEIGKITLVIDNIAAQTNLLALNATIEAARAGDAGSGFAVVASEVKALADDTAKAIVDIQRQIQTIQSDARESIDAISEIGTITLDIAANQDRIAASVEQQSMIANEIRSSLHVSSAASIEIADALSGLSQAASDTSQGTNQTLESIRELARTSSDLQQLVQHFKV
jgi:methyl-accepting chemotaxis protein